MIVIVGHGPGLLNRGLGSWLDAQTVIRLKSAVVPDALDWGSRTDYLCGSSLEQKVPGIPFWWTGEGERWREYFAQFRPTYKPSTGLMALFLAVERLKPDEVGLAGFDRLFRPDVPSNKWHCTDPERRMWVHDSRAEREAAHSLGVRITEI